MSTFLRKITSRKFLAALTGLAAGLAMAFGLDEGVIAAVAGAVTTAASVAAYVLAEGKVDAAAASAGNRPGGVVPGEEKGGPAATACTVEPDGSGTAGDEERGERAFQETVNRLMSYDLATARKAAGGERNA